MNKSDIYLLANSPLFPEQVNWQQQTLRTEHGPIFFLLPMTLTSCGWISGLPTMLSGFTQTR